MTTSKLRDADDWQESLIGNFRNIGSKPYNPYGTKYLALEDIKLPFEATLRTFLNKIFPPNKKFRTLRAQPNPFVEIFVFSVQRFLITVITGASLIVPMVIMSLDKSQTKSLITTSVAVMIVAGLLALIARNLDFITIISSTAAYAAVLVVFVGLSS
jgi:hypothetical protein